MSELFKIAMTYGIMSVPLGVGMLIASDFFDEQSVWLVPIGLLLVGPTLIVGLFALTAYAISAVWS